MPRFALQVRDERADVDCVVYRIVSIEMADGTPDLENIAVYPPKSQWNVPGARAVVKGAATLDGEWKAIEEATAEEKAAMRFFKVVVEVQ